MKRVLILGGSGMLGHKLAQVFADRFETSATVRRAGLVAAAPGLGQVRIVAGIDAMDFDRLAAVLTVRPPEVVVNCIGLVKQTAAARDPAACIALNALLPHRLAGLCRTVGSRLIHISTDCVFSGKRGKYTEQDTPDAEDLYGRSKLLGEVVQDGCLTLRTSILGPELGSAHGLLEWFRAQEGKTVRGFTHAVFSGVPTVTLARALIRLIEEHPRLGGLFHLSADPIDKNRLLHLVRAAYLCNIEIVPDDSLRVDRSLDSTALRERTGLSFPPWETLVEEMARDSNPLP